MRELDSNFNVTATPGFHSLYDWCYQAMWLLCGVPEDPEDVTLMEKDGANALYSAVMSLMHAIRTEDEDAQHDATHWMSQIAKPLAIRRWLESKLANGKPLVRIPKEIAHYVDLEWTADKQAKLQTLVERYTSRGALGAWRVHWWRLACFSVVLGDTDDQNNILDNGTTNGHSILGWILQFSDGWGIHFCQCLSRNLQSIPNVTKTKHHMRRSCTTLKVTKAPCLLHLHLKSQCYFVFCQAKFVIWSGGSQSFLRIIWIFSTCLCKWATMSAQQCSSNSKIRQISLCF